MTHNSATFSGIELLLEGGIRLDNIQGKKSIRELHMSLIELK